MTAIEKGIPYDVMDSSGSWLKTFNPVKGIKYRTLSGSRWLALNKRCTIEIEKKKNRSYKECANGFSSFMDFADWSQGQFGYRMKNSNGMFYYLDKDILIPGNKVYSPDSCCFVNSRVNNLIFTEYRKSTDLPIGVCQRAGCKTFSARANQDGKLIQLGSFRDPMLAHNAWQRFRAKEIVRVAREELSEKRIDTRIFDALINISMILTSDADDGRRTNFKGKTNEQ